MATNRSVCGTSQYNWNFTMVSPTVGLPIIVNGPTGGSRILGMGMITGIANGQRYDVKIRTRHLDGLTLSNYGTVKCVKTLGAAGMPSMDNINNLNILAERQDILIYPI